MEKMSPAELATKVKAVEPKNKDRYYDYGIEKLVDAARKVADSLRKGRFEESDNGYVQIVPVDTSDNDYSCRAIYGRFDIYFVDNAGYRTELGNIGYYKAEVNVSPDATEPLYPSDERWDAVVGSVGRAIMSLQAEA